MVRGVFDRLLGRLIEECESFGLATTMVIPSGLALDVQGAGSRGVDFVISERARITARQDRDLANNLLGFEPSALKFSITSSWRLPERTRHRCGEGPRGSDRGDREGCTRVLTSCNALSWSLP
jgi:hypothetical protein